LLQAREDTVNEPSTTSTPIASQSSSYNILVVDDEPDITTTFKIGLENNHFAVVDAYNDPTLALSNFKPDFYDLVLLDPEWF
jgi:CheY-like chemotaxis protein